MRNSVGPRTPANRIAPGLVAGLAMVFAGMVPAAQADVAVYQAAVPLRGTTEADRTAAFGEALKVAAVRATGRAGAAGNARVAAAAADPSRYVQSYGTTSARWVKVGFDARAMEQLLQQAGLPLWPAERPAVTVYLDSTATDRAAERAEVERIAQFRGVPVAWPAESADPAAALARAGGSSAVLVGKGGGGSYEWTYTHAGQSARQSGDLAAGVNLAADRLAERYATDSTRTLGEVEVRIGGLDGVRDYAALLQYLEGLSLVRDVDVREFAGNTVRLGLAVRGDRELLARIFALDGRLRPHAAAPGAATATVDFVWQAS